MIHQENTKKSPSWKTVLAAGIMKFLFQSLLILYRLTKDEMKRRKINSQLAKKNLSQYKKRMAVSRKISYLMALLGTASCLSGLGLVIYSLVDVVQRTLATSSITNFTHILLSDNPLWSYGWYLLVGSVVLGWTIRQANYGPGSRYYRHMKTMAKKDQFLNTDMSPKPSEEASIFLYPGAFLELWHISLKIDDIHKQDDPIWRNTGFSPSEPINLSDNRFVILDKEKKKSESTLFQDRVEEWRNVLADSYGRFSYYLGEEVSSSSYLIRPSGGDNFSGIFIGSSGSGKTVAMKQFLSHFLCTNPDVRVIIGDPKEGGDWEAFSEYTEFGEILKHPDQIMKSILYLKKIYDERQAYMKRKGYKDIWEWREHEGDDAVSVYLLVVDELPNFTPLLNFDIDSGRVNTPANALFQFATKGRSFGIWFWGGSQYGTYDYIPITLMKNISNKVLLKVGSAGESNNWLDSDVAFRISSKVDQLGLLHPKAGSAGYAYVNHEKNFVRFWNMSDEYILNELALYKVPKINANTNFLSYTKRVSEQKKLKEIEVGEKEKTSIWSRILRKGGTKVSVKVPPVQSSLKLRIINDKPQRVEFLPSPDEGLQDYSDRLFGENSPKLNLKGLPKNLDEIESKEIYERQKRELLKSTDSSSQVTDSDSSKGDESSSSPSNMEKETPAPSERKSLHGPFNSDGTRARGVESRSSGEKENTKTHSLSLRSEKKAIADMSPEEIESLSVKERIALFKSSLEEAKKNKEKAASIVEKNNKKDGAESSDTTQTTSDIQAKEASLAVSNKETVRMIRPAEKVVKTQKQLSNERKILDKYLEKLQKK